MTLRASLTATTVSTIRDGAPSSCLVFSKARVSLGKREPPMRIGFENWREK
jgi:hypothetical protein